jgi:NAD(P)-dependent dehydrogenase (short-subunit alcohol dehydrogenase family)
VTLFERGVLRALPVKNFPITRANEAFQFVAQAKHIGKIAIETREPNAQIVPSKQERQVGIRSDRTYMITGGLGGLGLSLASWFVQKGARHLVLVGRNAPGEAARESIRSLEENGAIVRVMRADIAQRSDVDQLWTQLRKDLPRLAGIVHAAAVLDDRSLLEQSAESFARVFAPKVLGAWNVHEKSLDEELDFFVMYSSLAALIGSPGQANYCAANAFLDALAHARMREGRPGMSIQWGAFSEVGLAAAQAKRGQRLSTRGASSISPVEGLEVLEKLLHAPRPEIGIARLDWEQLPQAFPAMQQSAFFKDIVATRATTSSNESSSLRRQIAEAGEHEGLTLIANFLHHQLARILRMESAKFEATTSFYQLGVDSLMQLELKERILAGLGINLPIVTLGRYPNLAGLSKHLYDELAIMNLTRREETTKVETAEDDEMEIVSF